MRDPQDHLRRFLPFDLTRMNVGLQPDFGDLRLGIGWPLHAGRAGDDEGNRPPFGAGAERPEAEVEQALERVEEVVDIGPARRFPSPVRSGVVCSPGGAAGEA